MTEEEAGRQAEDTQEPIAPPTPIVTSGDSPAAGSAETQFDADTVVDKLLAKLVPELDNRIDARFKSAKDKRFAKVEEILTAVKEAGGDPDKVRGRLEQADLYDRLDKIEASIRSEGAVGAAPGRADPGKSAEILQKAGISFDDPEVVEWANKKSFTSETQALAALEAIATKRAKQGNVTQAATVGAGAQPAPAGESDDELLERIEGLLKHPLRDIEERKKAIAEATKRGLMK